jgi:hypothetical protein
MRKDLIHNYSDSDCFYLKKKKWFLVPFQLIYQRFRVSRRFFFIIDIIFIVDFLARCCGCKREFDSTYPTYLNGIISQDEFRESINRINRIFTSYIMFIIFTIISAVILIGGIIMTIFGKKSENNSPALFGLGIMIIILGLMAFCSQRFITDPLRKALMRRALAEESMKYSSRSCRWILKTTTDDEGYEIYDVSGIIL